MGATTCVKYMTFIFNFIFFLMGCGILGLGIWLKVEKDEYTDITNSDYLTGANLVIAVGVIIFVVAFFGCCGAIKENSVLLLIFFILMLIIFVIEIGVGVFAYIKRGDIQNELSTEFRRAIKEEYGTDQGIIDAIDKFQRSFKCCGYDSYMDWRSSAYNNKTKSIPKSCCIDEKSTDCGKTNPSSLAGYYQRGCFNEVKNYVENNLLYIGGCAVAFAVCQLVGMAFAMYLYCQYRNGNSRGIMA